MTSPPGRLYLIAFSTKLKTTRYKSSVVQRMVEQGRMTEEEAHRYIQKCSMDSGTNMVETAEMVLSMMRF